MESTVIIAKKRKKSKVCLTCGHEYESKWHKEHPPMNENNKIDVKLAKSYCKEQTLLYDHKNCKPMWCDECQNLKEYVVDY